MIRHRLYRGRRKTKDYTDNLFIKASYRSRDLDLVSDKGALADAFSDEEPQDNLGSHQGVDPRLLQYYCMLKHHELFYD